MFYSYFLEIRNRFLLVIIGWFFTVFISYFYKETLLFLLTKPIFFFKNPIPIYFIFTSVTDLFSIYLKLVYFLSNQICVICFLYHFLLFLAPGLYFSEYKFLIKIFFISLVFFFLSMFIFYICVLPASWNFFLSFQEIITNKSINLYFEAKINEYLEFYINLYFVCNLSCQMFIIIILFLICIKDNLELIKKFRKIFYFSFVIFATIITPPDVITQLILSFSMVGLYEVLILSILIWKCIETY